MSLAKDKGHNVEFIKKGVPEGVGKFKSKFNKDVEYKFEVPGIYAYWCTPHKNMGMIGFVVVGDDKSNLEAIKKLRFSSKSKKMAPDLINSRGKKSLYCSQLIQKIYNTAANKNIFAQSFLNFKNKENKEDGVLARAARDLHAGLEFTVRAPSVFTPNLRFVLLCSHL